MIAIIWRNFTNPKTKTPKKIPKRKRKSEVEIYQHHTSYQLYYILEHKGIMPLKFLRHNDFESRIYSQPN